GGSAGGPQRASHCEGVEARRAAPCVGKGYAVRGPLRSAPNLLQSARSITRSCIPPSTLLRHVPYTKNSQYSH
ncbi:hypothetical protein HAX54_016200, partial [Datura stramonium]|nr:hypothetical protein [Datura stramonium]